MKNKRWYWWILGIVVTPFLLMLCLHVGIALGQYFNIHINVPNIDAADWFMFSGSYLGGTMTLLGVVTTIQHERKIYQHQLMIEGIEKEKERLNTVVNRLDIYAPSVCYTDFTSVLSIKDWNKRPDFSVVRRKILEAMSELNQGNNDLKIGTDIYLPSAKCIGCKHPCRIPNLRAEFMNTYTSISKYLFETLTLLDVFVVDQYNNAVKDELIHLYRENISQCQNNQITTQYSEKDIQDIQKLKKDMSIQQAELDQHLKEIAAMNQKEMVQLISLVNEYIALRMQEAERKCFGENHI